MHVDGVLRGELRRIRGIGTGFRTGWPGKYNCAVETNISTAELEGIMGYDCVVNRRLRPRGIYFGWRVGASPSMPQF